MAVAMMQVQSQEKAPLAFGSGGVKLGDIEQMWRFSQAVMKGGFACKGDTEESVLVKIAMGMELDIPPMMAIQNIAVINGRPSLWGDVVPGLVMSSGLCLRCEEWFEGDNDSLRALCLVQRKGQSAKTTVFGVDDAKRAGLWQTQAVVKRRNKDGGTYETANDSPWWKYPRRMLQMRARSWALRDAFPDVLRGLQIAEEARDAIDVTDSIPSPPRRQKPASARAMETVAQVVEEIKVNEDGEIIDADAEVIEESPFTPIDADERMRVFRQGQEAAARLGKTVINVEEFNECFGIDYDSDPVDRIESAIANWSPKGAPKKESPIVAPKPEPVADPMGSNEERAEVLTQIKALRSELGMDVAAVIKFCAATPELVKGPKDLTLAQLGRVVELLGEAAAQKGGEA